MALVSRLPECAAQDLRFYQAKRLAWQVSGLPRTVLAGLNELVYGPSLYDEALLAGVRLKAFERCGSSPHMPGRASMPS